MKKLLCVLMFGLVLGQDAITIREINISIDENTELIDIGNYVDLVSGFYTVQLIYINVINNECGSFDPITYRSQIGFGGIEFGLNEDSFSSETVLATINYENSNLIFDDDGGSLPDNCAINVELVLRVSGVFDDDGDVSSSGFLEMMPSSVSLKQNHPNPFNPTTTIEYEMPQNGNVNVSIYNIRGQLVEKLVDGYNTVGKYSIQWNPKNISSGQYFYQISVDGFVQTKKMVLLK